MKNAFRMNQRPFSPLSFDNARKQLLLLVDHRRCHVRFAGRCWSCTGGRCFYFLLCLVHSEVKEKKQRNPMELKGKSSSTTMKRIFSILRFLPVPGVSVRVAFRSSPDRYEPRNPSHLRPGREWSSLRWSRLARRGKFARRIFTRCPHVFEFLLLGIVLRFELVVERSTVVGLLWGFCKRE